MAMRIAAAANDRFRLAQNSDINVTPFVDIMLVLLIIFMVAIPAATVSVKLELPSTQTGAPPRLPTYVSVQADGSLYVGNMRTTLELLPSDLATAIGGADPKKERVYIRADRSIRYDAFVRVMDQLRAHGFEHVGLVTEEL
jgi:biopolymer transport protein ExbD